MTKLKIPVGIENFETIRTSGFYYIDKTKFIVELLQDAFSVNLISRPRRFGKTLMLNMLKCYLDIRKDTKQLFEGLLISEYPEICAEWMNQWPVLFISFKDAASNEYQTSYEQLAFNLSSLCIEHEYLLESSSVNVGDKKRFQKLIDGEASAIEIRNSILMLTRMMHAHYGKQVILLLDEYDVPLAKASEYGYYPQMLDLIRGMLGTTLKTNDHLKFAVVTGCRRIARESIFTGTNHFKSNSIDGPRYLDCFGFTETEVQQLLNVAGCADRIDEIRKWYDGYHFGVHEIYCPWDVVSYVSDLCMDASLRPGNYWKDTSHNSIIRQFIGSKTISPESKFEKLLAGGIIRARIKEDLTYDFEASSEDNFWSILYLTGYLTRIRSQETEQDKEDGLTALAIPNEEVRSIFADTVVEWFRDTMRQSDRDPLMNALWNGDAVSATKIISDILFRTISYHNYKEDYYHAFLAGLFIGIGYSVESDKEYGEGRPDIVVRDAEYRRAIIIEAKHSKKLDSMEKDCQKAIDQAKLRRYAEAFLEGYEQIVCYGAAFFEKKCLLECITVGKNLKTGDKE